MRLAFDLYASGDYSLIDMGRDVIDLMDDLGIANADVMGYSMGARITSLLSRDHPDRLRSAILGGLGMRLLMSDTNYQEIAAAMEAPSLEALTNETHLRRAHHERSSSARGLPARNA